MPEDAFSRPASNPNVVSQTPSPSEQPAQQTPLERPFTATPPVEQQQPQPPQQQVQSQQQLQQPQPPQQPQLDWTRLAEYQRMQQLEQQNAAMQQRLQEQDTALDNLMQMQQDYDALKRQQALEQQANEIDFSNLTSIDAEDARAISQQVLKSVQAKMEPLARALAEQRQQMQQNFQYQNQVAVQQRARNTLEKVMSRHPDFLSLTNDPSFNAFMKQRDGYTSKTLDDRAAEEFKMGNAEYIAHLVDQYKQIKPNTASIATVAPVQTATSPQTAPAGQPAQTFTLHDLNTMMQLGQITPNQYRAELAKIRAQTK